MTTDFNLEQYGPPIPEGYTSPGTTYTPSVSKVQDKLDKWTNQSTQFQSAADVASQQYAQYMEQAHGRTIWSSIGSLISLMPGSRGGANAFVEQMEGGSRDKAKAAAEQANRTYVYNSFWAELYTVAPGLLNSGMEEEEVLKAIGVPSSFDDATISQVQSVLAKIAADVTPAAIAEQATEEFVRTLEIPKDRRIKPTSVQSATVDAIIAQVIAPEVPDPVLTDEQWNNYLSEAGWIAADADPASVENIQSQMDNYLLELEELANKREAILAQGVELPEQDFWERTKFAILEPTIAMMDVANIYFEYVTQPLAGAVYSMIFPDIRKQAAEYAKEENYWKAMGHAWEDWDPDLPILNDTAAEWIMKYMLMEGAVDPLSFVGWGIATRVAKPFGRAGRAIGALEKGLAEAMELPFDLLKAPVKYKWTEAAAAKWGKIPGFNPEVGKFLIPRTGGQLATLQMYKAGQFTDKALSKITGKSVREITPGELKRGIKQIVNYTLANPGDLDGDMARAGRQLLQHSPVTIDETVSLARSVKSPLAMLGTEGDITVQTVNKLDEVFELFLGSVKSPSKLATTDEAVLQIMSILDAPDGAGPIISKWLKSRAKNIIDIALSHGEDKNTVESIRRLMKRVYKIGLETSNSDVAKARIMDGRTFAAVHRVTDKVSRVWTNKIDRYIVKSPAELYLMFTMYGYANVAEDIIRVGLGNVNPLPLAKYGWKGLRGEDIASETFLKFQRKWAGTAYEYRFAESSGIIESLGSIRKSGTNPLIGWLPLGLGDKITDLTLNRAGNVSQAIRMYYVDAYATQQLKRMGGEQAERLAKAAPVFTGLADKKLNKRITQEATELALNGQIDGLNMAINDFTRANILHKEVDNILLQHPDIAPHVRDYLLVQSRQGNLFRNDHVTISEHMNVAYESVLDDFIKSPELGVTRFEEFAQKLTELGVQNPEDLTELVRSLNSMSSIYGATPKQIMGRAVERTRGLPLPEREAAMNEVFDRITAFRERAGVALDKVVEKIKLTMADTDLLDTWVSKAQSLLDLQTLKRQRMSEIGEEINAWRRSWFSTGKPSGMNKEDWWNLYSDELTGKWNTANLEMARLDGQIARSIEQVDAAGGIRIFSRKPIKVTGRELAPADIGAIVGARGNDITKTLMESMVAVNDRDMFVEYITAMVREGDEGFTRDAIGKVYDQIVAGMKLESGTLDWMSIQEKELQAIRLELHDLVNSKMIDPEDTKKIQAYFHKVAGNVEKEIYSKPSTPEEWAKILGIKYDGLLSKTSGPHHFTFPKNHKLKNVSFAVDNLDEIPETIARKYAKFKAGKPPEMGFKTIKSEYANYNDIRQQAIDEAHKWYYKEFTDYTHGNVYDAYMKAIYPFWTYESQRFYWLPRSFVRHPGTFTAFNRWQDNSENGYIHVPGTSVDINPFRGTIYGTLTTRLSRRDYPEYYDSLGSASGAIEFNDMLSRYGFYPGVHVSGLLTLMGAKSQFGEVLPPTIKTGLDLMVTALPENESVKWISDKLFGDRFRDYLTMMSVNQMGGDGTLIFSKMETNEPLTDEEQQIWNQARRTSSLYASGFEQFGVFRLRTDEQYKIAEESTQVIEDMFGITKEQQLYAKRHNINLWELVGGLTPDEQAVLDNLDYYKYVGLSRPLLPGRKQEILNRVEVAWDEISNYVDRAKELKLQAERDFINGVIGPDAYVSTIRSIYNDQNATIVSKAEDMLWEAVPSELTGEERANWVKQHSLMTLEGRTAWYASTGDAQPVLHPIREIINLYYSIELKEKIDPETGQKTLDWDTFWAQRAAVENSVPEDYKKEFESFITKNSTPMELLRKEINQEYFQHYNNLYRAVRKQFNEQEQALIEEYYYLVDTNQNLARQTEIQQTESSGGLLISNYTSKLSEAKRALRYANPMLDAWLMFWGKTTSTVTDKGLVLYQGINSQYRNVS